MGCRYSGWIDVLRFILRSAFLGNHFPLDTSTLGEGANLGAAVLSNATQAIFGPISQIFLAVMVTVTCFTTTAGLIVATGEFFNKAFPQVSYKTYAIVFTLLDLRLPIWDLIISLHSQYQYF